jgi:putative endonuclease
MEKYFIYILYSKAIDRFYIGHTIDLEERLFRHRNSGSKSTKNARDWELVYVESCASRSAAMQRERYIKDQKSRRFIESLLETKA